jgi:xylan 1,4-beta-xylosidase
MNLLPLKASLIALFATATSFAMSQEPISINLKAPSQPTNPMPLFSVGSDRAAIFLRESHQRDLLALKKEIGFKYLRCHGIFNEEMKVVRRRIDGTLAFDWTNVDAFIDRLKAAGLRPFVEFSYMPEPLASGKDTVFYYRGDSTLPKSQAEWE